MANTANLLLPLILAAQAQKHVPHNEALRILDGLVQLSVKDRNLTAPPGSPVDGDRYIVAASPTGAWTGWAGDVALRADGAWLRLPAKEGWVAWVEDESALVVRDGSSWVSAVTISPSDVLSFLQLGLGGATPSGTNRLSVNSPASLFSHDGTDHEMTINKAATADDAAMAFKVGFSVRALFGLLGDDDFHVKVTPDGSTFYEALVADRNTGRVQFPIAAQLGGVAADPGSPPNGLLWHNSTTGQIKAQAEGRTMVLSPNDVPFLMPVSGEVVLTTTGAGGAATGSNGGVANRLELFPWIARADLTIDAVQVNVSTGVASAQGKVVCYAADDLGRPDALLFETGAIDFSTAALKTEAIAAAFLKGRTYWFGIRHSSTATVTKWASTATPDLNGGAPATGAHKVLRRSITFATGAPSSWTYTSSEMQSGPADAIWLRRA